MVLSNAPAPLRSAPQLNWHGGRGISKHRGSIAGFFRLDANMPSALNRIALTRHFALCCGAIARAAASKRAT